MNSTLFSCSKLSHLHCLDSFHVLIIFTIPTAQTASKRKAQVCSVPFSAQRIAEFLSTLTLHRPTENQGMLTFLSIPPENIPS